MITMVFAHETSDHWSFRPLDDHFCEQSPNAKIDTNKVKSEWTAKTRLSNSQWNTSFSGLDLCFTLLETAVYRRADKILGCKDHNPFWLVERTFSVLQLLLFWAVDFEISAHQYQINIVNEELKLDSLKC